MFRALLISISLFCSAVSAGTPIYEDFKLLASDGASYDSFGGFVSISGDGTTAIFGAPGDDDNGSNSGSAYIYSLVKGIWQETKLLASDGASVDLFGSSVSISSDGTTAIVGAQLNDTSSGSAYIYSLVQGIWQETKLLASDGASDDWFGRSVSISSDGTNAIVSAHGDDDNGDYSGSAYIYSLVKGIWQETKLLASDGAGEDSFGWSVSISSDGTTAIVGASYDDDNGSDSGSAYIYSLVKGIWQETKLLASDGVSYDQFGKSVSISGDGTTAIVGAHHNGTSSGSAYIYELIGGAWQETTLLASDGADYDYFGHSVSLSSDGTTAIVGAYGDDALGGYSGSAYVYSLVKGIWQETKLLASDGVSGDWFGLSVALSSDGTTAVVGAYLDDDNGTDSGSAYIYEFVDADGDGIFDNIDNCYLYNPDQADCNENGIGDVCDVADQTSYDCDQNGVPDECQPDCDGDGWIDPCDNEGDCDDDGIPDNCELDCNENSIPDDCDIIYGISEDCNENGVPDECDIANGLEEDCNENGIPDSCDLADDPSLDCDSDGLIDICAINDGLVDDCNGNNIPDSCDFDDGTEQDCNDNGLPDSCELDATVIPEGSVQWTIEEGGNGHWYHLIPDSGIAWSEANNEAIALGGYLVTLTSEEENDFVVSVVDNLGATAPWIGLYQDLDDPDYSEPAGGWKWVTSESYDYTKWAPGEPGDDGGIGADHANIWLTGGTSPNISFWNDWVTGSPDGYIIEFEVAYSPDCNANGVPDECDLEDGTSNDVNGNDIPDECEVDCNGNGVPDHWDIKTGTSEDCNANGIPDECDIDDGTSTDVNENGIPDECEVDCNTNGYPDDYDITMGWSDDVNGDGIPDECQCIADITGDNMVDVKDLLAIIGYWGSDGPLGDVNEDGIVDVSDLLIVVGNWGECE